MAWIDIVVLAVLLVFTIIGMVKGFLNTLISIFSSVASLGVAILCSKPVASFLDKLFHIVEGIGGKIAGTITGVTPFQTAEANGSPITQYSGSALKESTISENGLLNRLYKLFIEDSATFNVVEEGGTANYVASDLNITTYIGERVAAVISLVIATIVVFILLRIAVLLLSKLFKAITKNRAIGGIDRTMGMAFGFAKGALIVSLVLGVFYLIADATLYDLITNSTSIISKVFLHLCRFRFSWMPCMPSRGWNMQRYTSRRMPWSMITLIRPSSNLPWNPGWSKVCTWPDR